MSPFPYTALDVSDTALQSYGPWAVNGKPFGTHTALIVLNGK